MNIEKYELLNNEKKLDNPIKRVAAYCRVSTDNEDQANSFESQQKYYKKYILEHPDWELYGIFADEGVSGTSTKKRKEFNRMIECAKNGDIDLIITKEISRFARNTLDSISHTRQLKKYGVGVIFMNDNINTLDSDAELRLTIMSSIAQDESRRTSERVKWGQKRRMEDGVVFGCSMLGYDVENGKMTINEEGAKIVRLIYHKFVNEGKGTHTIARELKEEGIKSMTAKDWSNTVILRVLRNEKYCGDLVQKKTFTPDYLTHEKKYNRGEEEFVIIKNHHEPIVSKELFKKANEMLDERALSPEGKEKISYRYPFSGKIKCGICGSTYVARYKRHKDGSKYKAWRCGEGAKHGKRHTDNFGNEVGCSNRSIQNEEAIHIMYLAMKNLKFNRERVVANLLKAIRSVLSSDSLSGSTQKLKKQIEELSGKHEKLLELYMGGCIEKDEFTEQREKLNSQIDGVKSKIDGIRNGNDLRNRQSELYKDIEKAVNELIEGAEYEDEFYKQILDKMVIVDKNTIDLYLNILPEKWRFSVSKTIEPIYEKSKAETQVPISVSIPLTSL